MTCLRFLGYLSGALLMRGVAVAQTRTDTTPASEFLLVSGTDYELRAQGADMIGRAFRANQQLAPYLELFAAWSERHLAYNTLRPQVLTMIASQFTPTELRELTAFYRTPLGKKYAGQRGVIAEGYTRLVQKEMSQHYPELSKEIQRRAEELKQRGRTPP